MSDHPYRCTVKACPYVGPWPDGLCPEHAAQRNDHGQPRAADMPIRLDRYPTEGPSHDAPTH